MTIEITMELTDWLFFGGKIQFCLYYMIVWTLILWFPWFIVILGARLKKYLQEVQSNFHVTYTDTHFRNKRFYAWSKLFFHSQSCSNREKNLLYLVLVFEILELFCWTILSDFWRVYYIYLNYLLMDPEYYQKSSYLLQIACAWWLCLLER